MEISQEKRKTGHTLATLCLLLSTGECVEWALINLVATLTSIYESSDVTCAAARSFMKNHVPCAECGSAWAIWTALSVVTIPTALIAAAITNIAIAIDVFNSKL